MQFSSRNKAVRDHWLALDLVSKKVPTVEVLAGNTTSQKIEWYSRSDVAAAHKTSASLQMGFNLKVEVKDPAEQVSIEFQFEAGKQTQALSQTKISRKSRSSRLNSNLCMGKHVKAWAI
jgi:hypothetical protein